MKGGALVPKQAGGQVIAISNLQSGPVVSNHVSPKKQVLSLINFFFIGLCDFRCIFTYKIYYRCNI